jgi:heat shock protein HslJ
MFTSLTDSTRRSTGFRMTVLAIVTALSLGACGDSQSEIEGSWLLVSGTQSGTELPLEASNPLTLEFDSELASGHGGCNTFNGSYTLDGTSITFGPIASTQMACEALDLETMYMAGLGDVDTVSSDGDQLTLSGPQTEFFYEAAPTP